MSKEAKFHKLIESQDIEEKKRAWETLQAKLAEETEVPLPQPKKRKLSWVKLTSVFASIILIVMVGVYTAIKLQPDKTRYCSSADYQEVHYEHTLKEYSIQNNTEILYLDWYDLTGGTLSNSVFELNDTAEKIGFCEIIEDFNTGSLVNIFVIKKGYVLEEYKLDEEFSEKSKVKNIDVLWFFADYLQTATADFEYGQYQYYIKVNFVFDTNYILDIVEEMLPN